MSAEKELLKLLLPEYPIESIPMTKLVYWFRDVETSGFKSFSILGENNNESLQRYLKLFQQKKYQRFSGIF